MMEALYGALEAGGTKFVCAVGTGPDDLRDIVRFPTTKPEGTLAQALDYFRAAERKHGKLSALGIGSFGPIVLDRESRDWGSIGATPKAHWTGAPVASVFAHEWNIPIGFDTDVNGAVLAESQWGAGRDLTDLVYLTIGTGIGGGILAHGELVHGLTHPEVGHMLIPREPGEEDFAGVCPFHGCCLEGVASGPALAGRWGVPAEQLPQGHRAWELEAQYLALGLQNLLSVLSPQRVILGGGVMAQSHLFPLIRENLLALNNSYIRHPLLTPESIDQYVVPPALGDRAGILGALALAKLACE